MSSQLKTVIFWFLPDQTIIGRSEEPVLLSDSTSPGEDAVRYHTTMFRQLARNWSGREALVNDPEHGGAQPFQEDSEG